MIGSVGLVRDLFRHRDLIIGLTRRELFAPFAGSAFGVAWSLLHPLLQMGVYLVVFTFIFQMRMGEGAQAGLADYPSFVLSGLLPWLTWSALLSTACGTVINSGSLVKQADFPAEVLPVRAVLVCLVPHLVSLVVLGGWVVVRHGSPPGSWTLIPVMLAIQVTGMLGVAYVLSALCVFVRDAKEVVTVLASLGVFLSPAFYPPELVAGMPWVLRTLLALNPFSHFIYVYRDVLYWGEVRHPVSWVIAVLVSAATVYLGRRGFSRLRLFFGNFI